MRFISKNSNLMIVLSPGFSAQPLSGMPAKPGLYVKFKDGIVEVKDESIIEKLKGHPGFGLDYIAVEDKELDPFRSQREEIEPVHYQTEIKYGHAEKVSASPNRTVKIPPEIEKLVNQLAMEKIKEMLPKILEGMIAKKEEQKVEDVNLGKTGEKIELVEEKKEEPLLAEKKEENVVQPSKPLGKSKSK